jgi:hypothetical protein
MGWIWNFEVRGLDLKWRIYLSLIRVWIGWDFVV